MTRSLPTSPSLRHLRNEARSILNTHKRGDASCCRVLRNLREFTDLSDTDVLSADISLTQVQFSLALDYGLSSWEELKKHVARILKVGETIEYWARGWGSSKERKIEAICWDEDWLPLVDEEIQLQPLSEPTRQIRQMIGTMEHCHEGFAANVDLIVQMIGSMEPVPILDCGQISDTRQRQIETYRDSLERWLTGQNATISLDESVGTLLGPLDDRKKLLVAQLVRKLRDNSYLGGSDDWSTTEPMIGNLENCCHHWERNMTITLKEIGTGIRVAESPDGWGACGDGPDRSQELSQTIQALGSWAENGISSPVTQVLGERTPEKKWLVRSLCKHIRSQVNTGRIVP